jgi:hypothetical protein
MHSPTFRIPSEAVAWQQETRAALKSGRPAPTQSIKVNDACDLFLLAINDGIALNKRGKPYKNSSARTIEGALKGHIEQELGELPLDGIRHGQVQTL